MHRPTARGSYPGVDCRNKAMLHHRGMLSDFRAILFLGTITLVSTQGAGIRVGTAPFRASPAQPLLNPSAPYIEGKESL